MPAFGLTVKAGFNYSNMKYKKGQFKKGHPAPKTAFQKGQIPWNKNKKLNYLLNNQFAKGNKPNKTSFKKGNIPWNKNTKGLQKLYWLGKKRSKQTIEKIRKSHLNGGKEGICDMCGQKIWLTPTRQKHNNHFCSSKCFYKYVKENNLKKGKNSPSWQGGLTSLASQIRHSDEYKEWRKKVFEYDNYTCWICGQKAGKLEIHHSERFVNILRKYKIKTLKQAFGCWELWDINNGLTLCKFCHKTYTKFGII